MLMIASAYLAKKKRRDTTNKAESDKVSNLPYCPISTLYSSTKFKKHHHRHRHRIHY